MNSTIFLASDLSHLQAFAISDMNHTEPMSDQAVFCNEKSKHTKMFYSTSVIVFTSL